MCNDDGKVGDRAGRILFHGKAMTHEFPIRKLELGQWKGSV